MYRKILLSAFIFVLPLLFLPAQENFSKGEDLFMANKPREAIPYLTSVLAEDPANVDAALYLGMAHMQLGQYDEAIAVYRAVLPRSGNRSALTAFNLGNAYYSKGNGSFAEQYYSQAISADPAYAPAYLNRANTRVRGGSYKDALPDYEQYIVLEPASPQRPKIEAMISFIREEFAAEERRRLLAEAQAREEAERRQRLLDEVSASLQAAAEETKGLSAGTENVMGYEGEFELE